MGTWQWGAHPLLSHCFSGQRACVGCNISAAKVKKTKTLWQILPESQTVRKIFIVLPACLGFGKSIPASTDIIAIILPFPELPPGWNPWARRGKGMWVQIEKGLARATESVRGPCQPSWGAGSRGIPVLCRYRAGHDGFRKSSKCRTTIAQSPHHSSHFF